MNTALIILLFIILGLTVYYFYTTRYFRDLYGPKSILNSRQSIRIDQRFWPFRFFESLMNLFSLTISIICIYFLSLILMSDKQNFLLISLFFVVSLVCLTLPITIYLINRKLKELNDHEYIFDPNEKSLEVVGLMKIYKSDIIEIQSIIVGRSIANIKKIIYNEGSCLILSDFLSCFDVINEFFGEDIPKSYKDYDLISFTIKLYNGSI